MKEFHSYGTKPPHSTFDGAQRRLAHCEVSEVEASGPYSQSAGILYYLGKYTRLFYLMSSSQKCNWTKLKKLNPL